MAVAATATYLGALQLAYPTAPGTYDLSFDFFVGADCPAGSMIQLHCFERRDAGSLAPSLYPSSGTDDAGNFYGPRTFVSGNFVNAANFGASLLNPLAAGQKVHFSGSTVTISAPGAGFVNRTAHFLMFGILWQGTDGGVAEQSATTNRDAAPGAVPVHLVTGTRTAPIGTVDVIGVACANLSMTEPPSVAAVGSAAGVTCVEDGAFVRWQTILWDTAFTDGSISSQFNGPAVYLSKKTVTLGAPTAQSFGATLTDPTSYNPSGTFEHELDTFFAQLFCPTGLATESGLGGLWNLQSQRGQYHRANSFNGIVHYSRAAFNRPPMVQDVAVVTPPSGALDTEPRMAQELGTQRIQLVFTRTGGTDPGVYTAYSDDDGTTFSTPAMAFATGKHPDIAVDPTTGCVFRAAYVAPQIKATLQYPGDLAQSAPFVLKQANGADLVPDDAVFHVAPSGDGSRRWLLVMQKTGAILDFVSTDDGKTWK